MAGNDDRIKVALETFEKVTNPETTKQSVIQTYDTWAQTYEKVLFKCFIVNMKSH